MQIYIHKNDQQLGPFTEAEITAQLASGAISLQDHVWWQGQANWIPLGESPLAASPGATPSGSAPAIPSPISGATIAPDTHGDAPVTSKLAIWALVCGFVGVLCGPLQIGTVILGHLGLSEIKKNPNLKGRGMAIASLIVGYAWLLIVIVCVAISVLVALGNQVKTVSSTINSQMAAQATNSANQSPPTTEQNTNAPDKTAPAPAPTTVPDQTTNNPASSTPASTPTTNAPDSATNAAPMSQ